ncbi:hypothetical protein BTE77_34020 [Ensifer adhaerens]|nr:hypothetical protein BTE77_34020 [Ensifer adhaerens]
MRIDHQTVIRGNRGTLYSTRVFDLDAGQVVTLPAAGQRFMSLQVISEDHYTTTEYGAGPHTLDKNKVGTCDSIIGIRTLSSGTPLNVHRWPIKPPSSVASDVCFRVAAKLVSTAAMKALFSLFALPATD